MTFVKGASSLRNSVKSRKSKKSRIPMSFAVYYDDVDEDKMNKIFTSFENIEYANLNKGAQGDNGFILEFKVSENDKETLRKRVTRAYNRAGVKIKTNPSPTDALRLIHGED